MPVWQNLPSGGPPRGSGTGWAAFPVSGPASLPHRAHLSLRRSPCHRDSFHRAAAPSPHRSATTPFRHRTVTSPRADRKEVAGLRRLGGDRRRSPAREGPDAGGDVRRDVVHVGPARSWPGVRCGGALCGGSAVPGPTGPGKVVPSGPGVEATGPRHVCAVFRPGARRPVRRTPGTPGPSRRVRPGTPVPPRPRPRLGARSHAAASNPVLRASFFSSSRACFSICRIRSRVSPCSLPTSVRVRSRPSSMP